MKNVEITDDGIILKSKSGTITLSATDHCLGIFIANDHGQLNLVSQPNMPPYLCFYKSKDGRLTGYPSAMSADDGNDVNIQVGNKDPRKVKNIKLSELVSEVLVEVPVEYPI